MIDVERELAMLRAQQRRVTEGALADRERKRLLMRLWDQGRLTQRELSEVLTKAAVAAGGEPISENAVYKLLAKQRRREMVA